MPPFNLKSPAVLPLLLSTLLSPVLAQAGAYEMRTPLPQLIVAPSSGTTGNGATTGTPTSGTGSTTDSTSNTPSPTPVAVVSVSESSQNLGEVNLGNTGSGGLLTISNTGNAVLTFSNALSTTGAGFAVGTNCSGTLAPGASCVATVSFTPTEVGTFTGTLVIPTSVGTQSVALTGTGVGAVLSTSASNLTFGDVNVGDTTQVLAVQLNNTGNLATSVSGVSLTGTNANLFSAATTCGGALSSNASCLANVTFAPVTPGSAGATLNFNATDATKAVTLTGTGKGLTAGGTLIATAATGSFTLTTAPTTTLTNPASVALMSGGATVASSTSLSWDSASKTLSVGLGPVPTAGAYNATVLNASGKVIAATPVSVFNSTASLAVASGSSANYGAVVIGASAPESFTFTNTGDVPLTGITPSVLNNSAAKVTANTCGTSLAAGSTCTITVTYTPTVLETLSATLQVASSATNSPATVSLTGSSSPTPDPYIANVSLLLHMDGADNSTTFTDVKGGYINVVGAKITASSPKFGTGAGNLNTGFVTAPSSGAVFGTADFTIESWIKLASATSGQQLFDARPQTTNGPYLTLGASNGTLVATKNGTNFLSSNRAVPADGAWHHWAYVRSAGVGTFYIDGVAAGTTADTQSYSAGNLTVGWNAFIGANFNNAYLDDYRVTKGVARYNGNFTVPTMAFPNQ